MPKISVVMPVYNTEENFLKEAIESILNQTFNDFEFIIINDCSTNNVEDVILSYKDERIIYLKNEQNKGVSFSANLGLNTAKGKYIVRIDSDDVAMENRLEIQYKFLEENPEYQLCGTRITKAKGKASARTQNFEYQKTKMILRGNGIVQPTVMFNREFFIKNNLYYKEIPYGEDWDLWCRLCMVGKFVILPEKLLYYRIHENQVNKIYENRYYEFGKAHFKTVLQSLGFQINPQNEELLLNFLVFFEDEKLSFKQWKDLVAKIFRLISFIKQSKVLPLKYSVMILMKKLTSYTRHLVFK
jgi:glycosyltransferase involved in cell wall biosynthesis